MPTLTKLSGVRFIRLTRFVDYTFFKSFVEEEQMTLVTTFDGLMNRLIRPEKLERFILQLSLGAVSYTHLDVSKRQL